MTKKTERDREIELKYINLSSEHYGDATSPLLNFMDIWTFSAVLMLLAIRDASNNSCSPIFDAPLVTTT